VKAMEYISLGRLFYKDRKNYENIYQNRLNAESAFKLGLDIKNRPAFLMFDKEMTELVSEIFIADKRLSLTKSKLPKTALAQFEKWCLVNEVHLTNEIEGVYSTRKEINRVMALKDSESKSVKFAGLVKKYEFLLQNKNIDIKACKDVRKLYDDILLNEVLDENKLDKPDGQIFRAKDVHIHSERGIIHSGLTPESKIIEYMEAALRLINSSENSLINIALFHYLFGYIHPFYNGNGRLARFISSYFLSGILDPMIALNLSYTIKQNIKQYYKSFDETSSGRNRADLTYFVINFLEIIKKSAENVNESMENGLEKFMAFGEILSKIKTSDTEVNILNVLLQNSLFGDRGFSVDEIVLESGISPATVRLALKKYKNRLSMSKMGKKILYDINLDTFGD
jgi:Fic family protein